MQLYMFGLIVIAAMFGLVLIFIKSENECEYYECMALLLVLLVGASIAAIAAYFVTQI